MKYESLIIISSTLALPVQKLQTTCSLSTSSQVINRDNCYDKIPSLQWHGERYDGTSTRTGPLQSKN